MSDTSKTLAGMFGTTDFLIPMVLEDLTDEQARTRSRGGEGPSIAWSVGHLLSYRYNVLGMLGNGREDPHGDTFNQDATDGADYPAVADLQSQWIALAQDLHAALASKSEDDWNTPGAGAHDEKSLRDQVIFFAWHEGYHMGALGALRKAMGLPGPAEKVMAAMEAQAAGGG